LILLIIRNVSLAANHHIRVISERLELWCWKFSFDHTLLHCIFT